MAKRHQSTTLIPATFFRDRDTLWDVEIFGWRGRGRKRAYHFRVSGGRTFWGNKGLVHRLSPKERRAWERLQMALCDRQNSFMRGRDAFLSDAHQLLQRAADRKRQEQADARKRASEGRRRARAATRPRAIRLREDE